MSSVFSYNSSLVLPWDLFALLVSAMGWAALYAVSNSFLQPLAEGYFPAETKVPSAKTVLARKKFVVSAWKFMHYSVMVALGVAILARESWVLDTKQYFVGWPLHPTSSAMKLYYNAAFGLYFFACFSVFWEAGQSALDIGVMLTHHITTMLLISLSYLYSFHRIGMVIILLHDIADPIMELAKLNLYTRNTKTADFLFAVFALVFIATRNIIYPFYVIASVLKYCYWEDGTSMPNFPIHMTFITSLSVLAIMHVYWGALILNMVYLAITEKGVADDIRNIELKDE